MSKWSDDTFLDMLRQQGEPEADACVHELGIHPEMEAGDPHQRFLFEHMTTNRDPIPDEAPEPIRRFLETTGHVPEGTDLERIRRGQEAFMDYIAMGAFMLNKSLIEGYAAPSLSKILHMTGNMEAHPWKRSLGVVQMIINVASPGSFEPGGMGIVTTQKVRLLHGGIRAMVPKYLPDYREKYGVPLNQEDNIVSLMGFSNCIISSLLEVEAGITQQEADDLYYLWLTFGLMMGIHPPGEPSNTDWLPTNLDEASEFYAAYQRRHYVDVSENPEGAILAQADIDMLAHLVPAPLRRFGLDDLPEIIMFELNPKACERVGLTRPKNHPFLDKLAPKLMVAMEDSLDAMDKFGGDKLVAMLSHAIFSKMIAREYDGDSWNFEIPDSLKEVRRMAT